MPSGEYLYPATEVVSFGSPAAEVVRRHVSSAGHRRVFVMASRSIAGQADGPLQRLRAELGETIVGEFTAVRAHTSREDVVTAADLARQARADVVLAVGGGSVIDAAKAVLLCLWMGIGTPEGMAPFATDAPSMLAIEPPAAAIRMMSVSTTLSAADFTAAAGVTDSATRVKQLFGHRLLAPRVVVLDPHSALQTPQALLRATAVRSIDHAVETFCSPWANPATEPASLQGLRLLTAALRHMASAPLDAETVSQAQFGMWQSIAAAVAGVPTGASHGIGYALGSGFGVGHGETSCVMLPAVLQWNATAGDAAKQRRLSEAMGRPGEEAAPVLRTLLASLDLPTRLRDVGVQRGDFAELARRALNYPQLSTNVVPVDRVEQVLEILDIAW